MRGVLLGLLGCLLGCGAEPVVLPGNFVREGPIAAPALEPLCPEQAAPPATGKLWVVFGGVGCGFCKDWLGGLEAQQPVLDAHGITVVYYVGGTTSCARARIAARHVAYAVGVGTRQQSSDWHVSPTPVTVFVRDGQVIGRMLGATGAPGVEQLAEAFY